MKIEYNLTDSFQKDIKQLLKKYRTLKEDLDTAKRDAIEMYHLKQIDNQSVFQIQGHSSNEIKFFKIKKFACKALKGRGVKSGIRVIYAFHEQSVRVDFIEIYHKKEKANYDQSRVKAYLKGLR